MAEAWRAVEEEGVLKLELDQPGTEVNVLTSANMRELKEKVEGIASRGDLKAVLFTSAKKRIFIAGADIHEIKDIATREDAVKKAEDGKAVFQAIEELKIPTFAVINGACLGGGYELALACRYRAAAASAKVKIGLPEVNLGILPGFGGSIRMPKLLGLAKSLPLILAGRMVSAKQALKLGMIDRIFPEDTLVEKSMEWAGKLALSRGEGKRRPQWLVLLERFIMGPLIIYPAARRNILRQTKGHYPAPLKTLELIQKTYSDNSPGAFRKESEAFSDLAVTDISKNLINLFFLNERYKKKEWSPLKESFAPVKQCGVIGAGVMGGGIAQLVSYRDIPVKVRDIHAKALESALAEARRIYEGARKRGKIKEPEVERKMGLISVQAADEEIGRSDVIIEAVVEDLEIKKKIFSEWGSKISSESVLASNTSSLSVSAMAEAAPCPDRVVGLHFFNPVHRMPLVEIIRARQTSDRTLERVIQFARHLGKTVIVVQDSPGFLVNRLLMPYLNEAAFLMEEGMPPEVIDKIARDFGMPMGPVELTDQVGIDVGYKVAHILEEAFGSRMKAASILETVKEKGLLGRKTGAGFYLYEGKNKKVNPAVGLKIKSVSAAGREEAVKRLIYIMVNEAARCLEEKIIDEAATVDVGMIMGTGFPPFRGGLLKYADSVGTGRVVEELSALAKRHGPDRFEPCEYLRQLASRKQGFYEVS